MTFTEKQITNLAQNIAHTAFHNLEQNGVPHTDALEIAKDAGDAFAAALDRALREHDVIITKE